MTKKNKIILLIFSLMVAFGLYGRTSFACDGGYCGQLDYSFPPVSNVIDGNFFQFDSGNGTGGYTLGNLWSSPLVYGGIFSGFIGSSTNITGHFLGAGDNYTKNETDNWDFCGQDDNAFIAIWDANDSLDFVSYFESGGVPPSDNYATIAVTCGYEDTSTHVVSLDFPINGESTATSVIFQFTYYNNPDDSTIDYAGIQVFSNDTGFFYTATTSNIIGYEGQAVATTTLNLPAGSYTWFAFLHNTENGQNILYNFYTDFLVNNYIGVTPPNSEDIGIFSGLIDTLSKKAPFGYFILLKNALSGLNASSTPAYILPEEDNIFTNIFSPIRTGLTWILWLGFAVWLFKRLQKIDL